MALEDMAAEEESLPKQTLLVGTLGSACDSLFEVHRGQAQRVAPLVERGVVSGGVFQCPRWRWSPPRRIQSWTCGRVDVW